MLQGVAYNLPNRDVLFTDIHLILNKHAKVALIGNNGAGKSTLLKIMAGNLLPSQGTVKASATPYYVPQLLDTADISVAQALQVDDKLKALEKILDGHATEANLAVLDNDWTIEERCREALAHWHLDDVALTQNMQTLSGGQKTRVLLAGIVLHNPEIVLLDEPSNHLDAAGRALLYAYIRSAQNTLMVVSHDRTLLNLLDTVYELDKRGVTVYGGSYDFYAEQKNIERDALHRDLKSKEKELRAAKETEREALERKQKLDARGKKKQEKAGLPTISMNTFRNNAERSTARLKGAHAEKVTDITQALTELRKTLPGIEKMRLDFDDATLHNGKTLITARDINFAYDGRWCWQQGLTFQLASGERVALEGANGSGKTTLLKMILGELQPTSGTLDRAGVTTLYFDQDYSAIDNSITVYEQAQRFNTGALQEHDIKIRLNRFLFTPAHWDKPCRSLSGGEKMRLMLCSLAIANQAPDMMVLDEPTNNLDIQNMEILTAALSDYKGTLVVVSHDAYFLRQIGVERTIRVGG